MSCMILEEFYFEGPPACVTVSYLHWPDPPSSLSPPFFLSVGLSLSLIRVVKKQMQEDSEKLPSLTVIGKRLCLNCLFGQGMSQDICSLIISGSVVVCVYVCACMHVCVCVFVCAYACKCDLRASTESLFLFQELEIPLYQHDCVLVCAYMCIFACACMCTFWMCTHLQSRLKKN